ncbi:Outer membrane stress sensor protease DegS [hydrothermal vent metagenome]|uniref:Outer membrane stress sensor protease DegS n=1 Tax=hydrothermal vent metagenome TaxID=652676 RepID=A0A3B1A171_9ZZZZ
MLVRKLLPYFVQGIVIGLVIGLIFYFFAMPNATQQQRTVVEIKESRNATVIPTDGPASYANAVAIAAPSVVNINTTKLVGGRQHPLYNDPTFRRFFNDQQRSPVQRKDNNLGSGVIISEQGYILTNNHVIAGADEIQVALTDGRQADAQVIGTDPETDVAVLKISLDNLPGITFGQSDVLRVGDVVLAIGNPFGVGQTVTQGIVSATERSHLGISTYENFIQTDAAINPGNSGGALINAAGELVGINTAIYTRSGGSQGVGFAIPANTVKMVMKQILEYGRAIRGWLGIEIQTISPALAESFGLLEARGIIIAGVMPQGPADHAGVETGDIILQINGEAIVDGTAALNLIAQTAPGNEIHMSGIRQGEPFSITAHTSSRPIPQSHTIQ